MNKLLKKFLAFGVGSVGTLVLGLITSPIITRLIDPKEYGKFSMFNTVTNLLLMLLLLGLDQSYVRFFYEENEKSRNKLLRLMLKYPLIFNVFVSILILVFYKPITKFIIGGNSFTLAILLIVMNTFLIINRFAVLNIRMKQKAKSYSIIQILMKIFYIVYVLILYAFLGDSGETLIIGTILGTVTVTVIAILLEKKDWIQDNKNIEILTSKKELFLYGMPLILSMAITWIFQSIDKVFLNVYSGYVEVGLYAAAFSIVALLSAVQNTFTTFWVPVANEEFKKNPENREFFSKINKIVTLFMCLIGIGLITFKDVIIYLLGPRYYGTSFIFPFLIFIPIMYTVSETTVQGINFMKKSKYHIIIALSSATLNVILNFVLVPKLGAKGAAISTGISYVLFFYLRTIISKRVYKVNYHIGRASISIIALIVLASYSTFNNFNIKLLGIAIISGILIMILYVDCIKDIIDIIKTKIFKKE